MKFSLRFTFRNNLYILDANPLTFEYVTTNFHLVSGPLLIFSMFYSSIFVSSLNFICVSESYLFCCIFLSKL